MPLEHGAGKPFHIGMGRPYDNDLELDRPGSHSGTSGKSAGISIHLQVMAKEKNKPVPVRFDLKLLEVLKEEEKIDTPQQALNFLAKFWENNRPAKGDFAGDLADDLKKVKKAAPVKEVRESKDNAPAAHPSGLSGIDLSIWKAEQKEKNKGA